MALWGKSDLVYNVGKVNVHFAEKEIRRQSGSIDFVTAGVSTGDVITVGTARTYGQAVISGVVGVHTVSIASTQFLNWQGTNTISSQDYYINQQPKSTLEDPNYNDTNVGITTIKDVVGIDDTEAGTSEGNHAQHAGWVGVTTYIDCHGHVRKKMETLVAMSGITSDRP